MTVMHEMTISYDEPSDSLHIDSCVPYKEQDSNEIQPGVVVRSNPSSSAIENLEIMFFMERCARGKRIGLSVNLNMRLSGQPDERSQTTED